MTGESIWNTGTFITGMGKSKNSEKDCPTITLSTTNPTRARLGLSEDLGCDRPTTLPLSHCTATYTYYDIVVSFLFITLGSDF
jgi:hypothetical protein